MGASPDERLIPVAGGHLLGDSLEGRGHGLTSHPRLQLRYSAPVVQPLLGLERLLSEPLVSEGLQGLLCRWRWTPVCWPSPRLEPWPPPPIEPPERSRRSPLLIVARTLCLVLEGLPPVQPFKQQGVTPKRAALAASQPRGAGLEGRYGPVLGPLSDGQGVGVE